MSKQYSVLTELTLKANKFKDGLNEAGQKTNKFAKGFADKTKSVGKNMQSIGKSMTTKVTLPIAAAGTGAVAAFKSFDDSMRETQALLGDELGDTVQEQEKNLGALTDKAKEMGIETKFSASEASDAMGYMALAGFEVDEIMTSVDDVLNLASASNMDLALASDIVTDSLSMFGMEADEAERMVDVLAKTSSSSNTDVEQLSDALVYVGANAHAAGMDIETTSALIGKLADNGIKGGKAGTTLNSMLQDMKESAEDGALAIGDTSVALYDSNGEMRDMTDVLDDLIGATSEMDDEQRDLALSQIFGQQALKGVNALMEEGEGATKGLREELYLSKGTAEEMSEILEDGLGGSLRELKSALEGLAISFGETLAPMLEDAIDKVTEWIRKLSELDEDTKKTILAIAGIAAVIGPLVAVGGTLLVFLSSAISVFSAFSGAVASAGGAIGLLSNPIGWAILAIGALIASTVAIYKNFDKLEEKLGTTGSFITALINPIFGVVGAIKYFQKGQEDIIDEIDRFGDKVSDNTKKVLGEYFDLADGTKIALDEMAWSQQEVTKESAEKMIKNYDEMNDQIVSGLEERHEKEIKAANEQFDNLDGISSEQKTEILQKLDEHYNKEIEKQEDANDKITKIFKKASDEKRTLTQDEYDDITQIHEDMNKNAVQSLSENEVESKIILERMKEQSGNITARQAADVVKNSKKSKDKTVKNAEEQYDGTLEWIIRQRDETGTISAEQAEELITEAKNQRDGVIDEAEDMHENVVKEAREQAGEHEDYVNWETGEVLSHWERLGARIYQIAGNISGTVIAKTQEYTNEAGRLTNEFKNKSILAFETLKNTATSSLNGLKNGAINAFTQTANTAGQKFAELKSGITTNINEAGRIVGSGVGKIRGFFTNLKLKIPVINSAALDTVKSKVESVVSGIRNVFNNLKLKIPSIELPSLPKPKVTGDFSIKPPSVPKFSWFAEGGLMTNPTVFGRNGNTLLAGGEAGQEAILPLTKSVLGDIGDRIAQTMNPQTTPTTNTESNSITNNYDINLHVDSMTGSKEDARTVLNEIVRGVKSKGGKLR